ncbi:DcuC family C4-dicarboxylate transporter [Anaerospora hongkongensis]|uniref:DcuC family C4-dicarboxylate transporter n=1 Tax=Anaerospora hongkongensis TaxID=244830 RepID=A0A4R1Q0C8_9FIRM|nr:C4-dicarboxylate transporter DcuC [Anaerospora hongkongensis]TCL36763.1 DcuC family C4-dicarboxylate transporter [Anaerospora hongkongensis]
MIYIGLVIIALSIYLLVKQYESRMVLLAAGIAMAAIAGDPLAAFDAFSKSMVNGALIQAICSVMGFAFVMKLTECDKHLVNLFGNGLRKIRPVLVPAAVMATFAINVALPSAAGAAAAVGAIFIPILISSGVHPATAGAAVLAGTFGSMLNPGLSHNPFVAKLAGVGPMDVIAVHAKADIIGGLIGAFSLAIVDKYLTKDKAYGQGKTADEMKKISVNLLYAIIPLLPVVLLMLGTVSSLPVLKKVGVPHAMLIGAIIALAVTRTKPQEITKAFFEGMGNAFANIMGIIIAAGVFVGGMTSIGLVKAFIDLLTHATGIVKYAATFGPFLLAVIAGSGDAAAFAFNEAVTPHAQKFGLEVINMGSIAALTGCFGRTMSPIAGATIVCATIAGVSPMELAKRNAPGMIIATIVSMFILL